MEVVYNSKGDLIGSVDKMDGSKSGWFGTVLMPNDKEDKEAFFRYKKEAIQFVKKEYKKSSIKNQKSMKAPATKKPATKSKKRVSARTICRKVIFVPGINKRTGQLLKGWHYVNGVPQKVKPAIKKKTAAKKGLKGSNTQTAAQKQFAINAKKARDLVSSGKAKTLKTAWAILKKK